MAVMVCTTCRSVGKPKSQTQGSLLVEVALWVLFCFPGLIYSLWRLSSRTRVCRQCGSPQIVPLTSPVGRQLTGGAP